jgi:CRP-like cAMP-binding protein
VVDIFTPGDFLGEWSLVYHIPFSEHAVALDDVSLLAWTPAEIEEQCERHPQVGIRLINLFIQRALDHQARLQSFALEGSPERLARSLLHFADRMGTRADRDFIEIPPLTHQVIADYVGTTREMINSQIGCAAMAPSNTHAREFRSTAGSCATTFACRDTGASIGRAPVPRNRTANLGQQFPAA